MRGRRGYTLMEVAIAMLLTAIMASAVFSIALSAKRGGARGLRRVIADEGARQLTERLKGFAAPNIGWTDPLTISSGPNSRNTASSWYLTENVGSAPLILDSCGDSDPGAASCYALAEGTHTVTGILPDWFKDGYGAKLKYYVDYPQTIGAGGPTNSPVPRISVSVTWNEQ